VGRPRLTGSGRGCSFSDALFEELSLCCVAACSGRCVERPSCRAEVELRIARAAVSEEWDGRWQRGARVAGSVEAEPTKASRSLSLPKYNALSPEIRREQERSRVCLFEGMVTFLLRQTIASGPRIVEL